MTPPNRGQPGRRLQEQLDNEVTRQLDQVFRDGDLVLENRDEALDAAGTDWSNERW
jgi:hypothetical protein